MVEKKKSRIWRNIFIGIGIFFLISWLFSDDDEERSPNDGSNLIVPVLPDNSDGGRDGGNRGTNNDDRNDRRNDGNDGRNVVPIPVNDQVNVDPLDEAENRRGEQDDGNADPPNEAVKRRRGDVP